MKYYSLLFLICMLTILSPVQVSAQNNGLDKYVSKLKQSQASGGSETAFMSIGSDFMYAQEYFESGNYSSAASRFEGILRRDKDHPYANYQYAVSLLKQNDPEKTKHAQSFLEKSFTLDQSLKERYRIDFPSAKLSSTNTEEKDTKTTNSTAGTKTNTEGVEGYIQKIKHSRSIGGPETTMLSAGLDAFYGIEYYEVGEYSSASTNFNLSLAKEPNNIYVNYLNAVALTAQGKNTEAKKYLQKAIAGDKTLETRFTKDAQDATAKWKKFEASKVIKTSPATKEVYGGPLVYGKYTCHVNVWMGPNAVPAYRPDYKGYFELRKDGTYRWLDNGATGRYKYNSATGTITWLSGYFPASKPKSSLYQAGTKTAQINIQYSESLRWQCGCDK